MSSNELTQSINQLPVIECGSYLTPPAPREQAQAEINQQRFEEDFRRIFADDDTYRLGE